MNYKITFLLIAVILLTACSASAEEPVPTLTAQQQQGQAVFNLRCSQCHALTLDTIVIGPSIAGIATRGESRVPGYDAEAYIEMSILTPDAYLVEGFPNTMPTNFGKQLTSEELNAVVAYLMTLK
jgi:mono/diheme cytochrome c family protein